MYAQVIELEGRKKSSSGFRNVPSWYEDFWKKPVVYHVDCLERFMLVKDDKRFSTGYAWFCVSCGKPVFCYEHYFDKFDYFAVVKLLCHLGCWNSWRMQDIDPLIATIADNIDWNAFEEAEYGLVLRSGTLVRIIHTVEDDKPKVIELYKD